MPFHMPVLLVNFLDFLFQILLSTSEFVVTLFSLNNLFFACRAFVDSSFFGAFAFDDRAFDRIHWFFDDASLKGNTRLGFFVDNPKYKKT